VSAEKKNAKTIKIEKMIFEGCWVKKRATSE
jgi:hypothetical protein